MFLSQLLNKLQSPDETICYGEPWRYGEKSVTCVIPILQKKIMVERDYLLLSEAKNVKITDKGRISPVQIENGEPLPVFIRLGEILKGATQERSVTQSHVIAPGATVDVPVVCIHASRPLQHGASFTAGGFAPMKDALFAGEVKCMGHVDQRTSWNMDRSYYAMSSSHLGGLTFGPEIRGGDGDATLGDGTLLSDAEPDNLSAITERVREALDEVIKKVPLFNDQIGMALIGTVAPSKRVSEDGRPLRKIHVSGLQTLECFDLPDSWKAIKEMITGKEAIPISDVLEDDSPFKIVFEPEKTTGQISKVLAGELDVKTISDDKLSQVISLSYPGYVGEATILNDHVIHLLITRNDKPVSEE